MGKAQGFFFEEMVLKCSYSLIMEFCMDFEWDEAKNQKNIRYKLDVANPPRLTPEQEAELAVLAAMTDDEIDLSDIPEAGDDAWQNAVVGKFYRPIKKQVTVRIDADILAWLQAPGSGYQTRLNQVLREAMNKASQQAA